MRWDQLASRINSCKIPKSTNLDSSSTSKDRIFRQHSGGGKEDKGKENADDITEEWDAGLRLHSRWCYINVHCKLAGACLSADSLQNTPLWKLGQKLSTADFNSTSLTTAHFQEQCMKAGTYLVRWMAYFQMIDMQVMKHIKQLPPELPERILMMLDFKTARL